MVEETQAHGASVPEVGKTSALKDPFQAVQWLMIGILGHQRVRQQPRRRDAFIDYLRWHGCLDELLAAPTHPFTAHMSMHLENTGCSRVSRSRPDRSVPAHIRRSTRSVPVRDGTQPVVTPLVAVRAAACPSAAVLP